MTPKLLKPHPQIYLVVTDKVTELGRMFVRIQEFFESPSKRFRGQYFTLEAFKKWYCKTQSASGDFTYYSDFGGYNVPGNILLDWQAAFAGSETEDEQKLLGLLGPLPSEFYVIGAPRHNLATINHELSHAFYHLFPIYAKVAHDLLAGYDFSGIHRYLKAHMYRPEVYEDEVISYTLFDWPLLNRMGVKTKHLGPARERLRSLFDMYATAYLRPRGEW